MHAPLYAGVHARVVVAHAFAAPQLHSIRCAQQAAVEAHCGALRA
jgi:hypothetical protein